MSGQTTKEMLQDKGIRELADAGKREIKQWMRYTIFAITPGDTFDLKGVELDLSSEIFPPKSVAGILAGEFEGPESDFIEEYFPNYNLPIIDLGGGIGFTSCIAHRATNSPVYTVEANPLLIDTIKKHAQLNNSDITVLNKAYSTKTEKIKHRPNQNPRGWNTPDEVHLETVSIQDIITDYRLDEFLLIADLEGAEQDLLNESDSMKRCQAAVIELHDQYNHEKFLTELSNCGLEVVERNDDVVVLKR